MLMMFVVFHELGNPVMLGADHVVPSNCWRLSEPLTSWMTVVPLGGVKLVYCHRLEVNPDAKTVACPGLETSTMDRFVAANIRCAAGWRSTQSVSTGPAPGNP